MRKGKIHIFIQVHANVLVEKRLILNIIMIHQLKYIKSYMTYITAYTTSY